MADYRPDDPRQLLEDAANAVGGFSSVKPDAFPTELRSSELDAWVLDPRENELDHEASGAGRRLYEQVPIEYIYYIVTEGGDGNRSAARTTLDTLRDTYVTQMFDTFEANGALGTVQKTARIRREVENGELALFLDAISVQVWQHQDY